MKLKYWLYLHFVSCSTDTSIHCKARLPILILLRAPRGPGPALVKVITEHNATCEPRPKKKKKLFLLAEAGMPRHGDHLLMPLAQWCQFFLGPQPLY